MVFKTYIKNDSILVTPLKQQILNYFKLFQNRVNIYFDTLFLFNLMALMGTHFYLLLYIFVYDFYFISYLYDGKIFLFL